MKILVTESQLRNLVKRHKRYRKDAQDVDEAESLSSPSTTNTSTSSSASTTDPGGGGEDNGKSMSASEYPAYPQVGHWESGIARGPANQIATKSNWSEVVGSKLTRGHANPLK